MRLAPTPENPSLEVKDPRVGCITIGDKMPETKTCLRCHTEKPIDLFDYNRTKKDGRQGWCRNCQKEYDGIASRYGTNRYWSGRELAWKRRGIILTEGSPFCRSDYLRLSEFQGGSCALCGRHPPMWSPTLAVDHNARTGLVRGLLCTECNHKAVGTFERHGHFTRRKEVNDLIRSYLENPPASRLPARAEAEPEPLPDTPVYSVITSPPKSYISWTPLFAHEATL